MVIYHLFWAKTSPAADLFNMKWAHLALRLRRDRDPVQKCVENLLIYDKFEQKLLLFRSQWIHFFALGG